MDEPLIHDCEFLVHRRKCFDTLNHLGVHHKCDRQTDRWTDSLTAYAVLYYVAQPKNITNANEICNTYLVCS